MTIKYFEFDGSSIVRTKAVDSVHYYPVDCDESAWEISIKLRDGIRMAYRGDYTSVMRKYNAIRVILLEETGVDDDLE